MPGDSLSLPLKLSPPATFPPPPQGGRFPGDTGATSFWDLLLPRDLVDVGQQLPGEGKRVEDTK